MYLNKLIFLFFTFFISSCSFLGGNTIFPEKSFSVHFFDRINSGSNSENGVVDIYLDAAGDVYPNYSNFCDSYFYCESQSSSVVFKSGDEPKNWLKNKSIKNIFMGIRSDLKNDTGYEDLVNGLDSVEKWRLYQKKLYQNKSDEILNLYNSGNYSKQIVFLIHGFNTKDARKSYMQLRNQLIEANNEKPLIFVQFHWDGQSDFKGWPKAQATGSIAGFKLRQLINYLNFSIEDLSLRVVTHSSGAFLIGSSLGDASGAQPLLYESGKIDPEAVAPEDWDFYLKNKGLVEKSAGNEFYIPKLNDLKILFFAAATSSNTFTGSYGKTNNKVFKGFYQDDAQIIFSIKENDKVLDKYVKLKDEFGASGLGSTDEYFCLVKKALKNNSVVGFDYDWFPYDLPISLESHSFVDYINHKISLRLYSGFLSKSQVDFGLNDKQIKCK